MRNDRFLLRTPLFQNWKTRLQCAEFFSSFSAGSIFLPSAPANYREKILLERKLNCSKNLQKKHWLFMALLWNIQLFFSGLYFVPKNVNYFFFNKFIRSKWTNIFLVYPLYPTEHVLYAYGISPRHILHCSKIPLLVLFSKNNKDSLNRIWTCKFASFEIHFTLG